MEKYIEIFNQLWEHTESEVVEFKKAETNFDIDELGKYFSALSNEANLRGYEFAWIVFGVLDKKHQIIGTSFKDTALKNKKKEIFFQKRNYHHICIRQAWPLFRALPTLSVPYACHFKD